MKNAITKTEQLRIFVEEGDFDRALSIAKTFKRDFLADEKRLIEIAHECKKESGANFYKGLGVDTGLTRKKAIDLLIKKYSN
jgi:hypothetical protein